MSQGGGKYGDEVEALLRTIGEGAMGALIIVFGDASKAGFSFAMRPDLVDSKDALRSIPPALRMVADEIEKDVEVEVLGGHQGTS